MKKLAGIGLLVLLTVSIGGLACAEKEVSLSQVPPAVKAAIEEQATGGKILEIEQDMEDGQMIYEAIILKNSKKMEFEFSSTGQLITDEESEDEEGEESGSEQEIRLNDAPAAVQAAIKKAAGSNPILKIEQETEEGVSTYEADYDVEGVKYSVKCAASGDVMEMENEVSPQSLPVAALEELQEDYPGASIEKAELVMKLFYEVEMKKGNKTFEVKVSAAGDIDDDEHHDEQDNERDED